MNLKKSFASIMVALVLSVAGFELYFAKPVHASAGDYTATFFGNASTVGTVITATTGKRLIIKEMVITLASSGTLVFQDHPATGSNVTFGQVGLLAAEPFHVPTSMLQSGAGGTGGVDGYTTGSGSSFVVVNQNAASIVAAVWVRYALN